MEKKTKVMVAVAVMALVIGVVIYFYTKKKKEDAANAKLANAKLANVKPSPRAFNKNRIVKEKVKPAFNLSAIEIGSNPTES